MQLIVLPQTLLFDIKTGDGGKVTYIYQTDLWLYMYCILFILNKSRIVLHGQSVLRLQRNGI